MPLIKELDSNTINKIAAGEVIERPAAVVKELIENSIDAKANSITIEIKEGGISFIRITDNGVGIASDDIDLAFKRHSTSKISCVEDLMTVKSLGFRGEALSSIASVAQVELITKTDNSMLGNRYVIEGGIKKTLEEIGCPEGTTFIIRNLFFNTPVRRKFLKSPQTEAGYVAAVIEKAAAAHPEIAFKFINNGQVKLHTNGNSNLKDIIYTLYGRDITSHLLEINNKSSNVAVSGYIAKPIVSRGNRNFEIYYINGRPIKSNIIYKAIEDGYKSYTMQHRYPFVVLNIQIESSLIDVNVHPTKMEIRFSNPEEVYNVIYSGIKDTLANRNLIHSVTINESVPKKEVTPTVSNHISESKHRLQPVNKVAANDSKNMPDISARIHNTSQHTYNDLSGIKKDSADGIVKSSVQKGNSEGGTGISAKQNDNSEYKVPAENTTLNYVRSTRRVYPEPFETKRIEKMVNDIIPDCPQKELTDVNSVTNQTSLFDSEEFSKENKNINFNIVGQVFSTYWIVEYDNNMYIIDQHAAHEKVLFEKTMRTLKDATVNSQFISPPLILSLSMAQENVLNKYMDHFIKLGYEIDSFGDREYQVRAVPADLPGVANNNLLIELLDSLSENDIKSSSDLILDKVASLSCKAAIKGNQTISLTEAKELINQLMELDNPFNCPHGRPTIISMSKSELEKKFKRIV